MPESQLGKLQIIQNAGARLMTGTKKYSPITPGQFYISELHLLPVKFQISFKFCHLLICLHNMAQSYLQESTHLQEIPDHHKEVF